MKLLSSVVPKGSVADNIGLSPRTIANRKNAQRSTGPRTTSGKAVVAANAIKHGLLSAEILLPEDDQTALAALAENFLTEFKPEGSLEHLLVDRMVSLVWRLARLGRVESELLQNGRGDLSHVLLAKQEGLFSGLGVGFGFDTRSDALAKLARYETGIDRALHRALHELQRLQAARQGQAVPLPVAVDVTVVGSQLE